MPNTPFYSLRLLPAIEKLKTFPAPLIGRRNLEELLDISKTVAWRVLRHCGAQQAPGGALICDRLQLIAKLTHLAADGGPVARELARHNRVETQLTAMRSFMKSRETIVAGPEQSPALLRSKLKSLPENVTLTADSLRIDYRNMAELLAGVGAVVFALQNDYEAVAAAVEG